MSMWNGIKTLQERYNLAQWTVMTFLFLSGVTFNAITKVTDWIYLPFDNKRNITILLEKSEELSGFIENLRAMQLDLRKSTDKNSEDFSSINKNLDSLEIELKAHLRRLEDGQLQLFLKTERLDERTKNTLNKGGTAPCGDQC